MTTREKDILEPLEQIKKVDPPPFMLTVIEERIRRATSEWVTAKQVRAIVITCIILVILNAFAIVQIRSSSRNERNIAQTFQLMPENNLYE